MAAILFKSTKVQNCHFLTKPMHYPLQTGFYDKCQVSQAWVQQSGFICQSSVRMIVLHFSQISNEALGL